MLKADYRSRAQVYADLGIAVVALIWGISTVLCKLVLASLPPFAFQSIRFWLAFIVLGLFFFPRLRLTNRKVWKAGIITGLAIISAYSLQVVGMVYTSATNSAFLISMGVVIIPLFNAVVKRRLPSWAVVVSVLLCLVGLYLLTGWQGSFNRGDLLCLIGAAACSLYYILNDALTRDLEYLSVAFIQLLTGAVVSSMVALLTHAAFTLAQVRSSWLALLFISVLATALVTPLQVASQRYTTTTRVGIILLLEPVTAAILAFFFLHEVLGLTGVIGCLLILGGLFIGELKRI
jgi:drug/metabolite transporter (DMT)-like permease